MPNLTKLLSVQKSYTQSPFYIKFGVPVLLLVLVTLFKLWLAIVIGRKIAFMLYFGVVIIASRYYGAKAGLWTIFLAVLASNYFFIPPYYGLYFGKVEIVQTILFVAECSLIVGLSSVLSRAINKVQEADRLFKAMIEKSAEGIIMVNAHGKRIYFSPAVLDMLGYTFDEFMGFEAWQLGHPDELLDVREKFFKLASHPGDTLVLHHRMKHKNGSWVWVESKTTNLLDDPAVNALISNVSNVTERLELEKQREDFIGLASHELKTPVTSLKAYTQVLRSRFKDSADQTSYSIAKKMDQQVNHVTRMITALFDITTLQNGELHLDKIDFDLNALIIDIAELLQNTTEKHTIETVLVLRERVVADKERIGQVITNFVANAIKYSPRDGLIRIESKIEGRDLIVSVSDEGVGIPANEMVRIFDRFYRVDTSKNTTQGLGLGLYISSQIIAQHGGKIGVDSEEGKGSTFWFSLPL